jgi:hypothetical protein
VTPLARSPVHTLDQANVGRYIAAPYGSSIPLCNHVPRQLPLPSLSASRAILLGGKPLLSDDGRRDAHIQIRGAPVAPNFQTRRTMIKLARSMIGFNPAQWLTAARRMRRLILDFQSLGNTPPPSNISCCVVVTPWLGTPIPWYSIGLGVLLANRGLTVTFILDDQRFGNKWWRYRFVLGRLRSVLRVVSRQIEVRTLSQIIPQRTATPAEACEAERLARLNAVWEMRGEVQSQRRDRFAKLCSRQLLEAFPRVHATLSDRHFDLLVIPGGVWGTSGVWTYYARQKGIRISSFDCGGYGTVMLAANGIACQLHDIPEAFRRILADLTDPGSETSAIEAAHTEMAKRRSGSDTFLSQIAGSDAVSVRYDNAVLLALNSSWDSAALGLHTVFRDNTEWIIETIRLLLDHTRCQIVVRQHPAERLEIARTSDDYRALLQRHFPGNPRVHLITAHDKVNSYELLKRIKAIVVYTSTIGIEAAATRVPVITPSNSYYSRLGFVFRAESLADYLALLVKAADGTLRISEEQQRHALLCFYLTQCCNWVFSPFNPGDFRDWGKTSLSEWERDSNVAKLLDAIEHNVPVAYLNHLERRNRPNNPTPST